MVTDRTRTIWAVSLSFSFLATEAGKSAQPFAYYPLCASGCEYFDVCGRVHGCPQVQLPTSSIVWFRTLVRVRQTGRRRHFHRGSSRRSFCGIWRHVGRPNHVSERCGRHRQVLLCAGVWYGASCTKFLLIILHLLTSLQGMST